MYSKEDTDLVTIDISNFSIQTPIYRKPGWDKITMKIKGVLVDMLVQMDLGKLSQYSIWKMKEGVISWGTQIYLWYATIISIVIYKANKIFEDRPIQI